MNNKKEPQDNPSSDSPQTENTLEKNNTKNVSHENTGEETPESKSSEKTAEEKLAELTEKYVRLFADFENFRKRIAKERLELLKYAGEEIFTNLLPVLDDFERAFKSMETVTDVNVIKQGEELIYGKMKTILSQLGLEEMKSVGEPFNPDLHDAVTNVAVSSEEKKGKVMEVVEKGYFLNGKVIRHAKVVVGN